MYSKIHSEVALIKLTSRPAQSDLNSKSVLKSRKDTRYKEMTWDWT